MNITQKNLLLLADRWMAAMKRHNADAGEILKMTDRQTAHHTQGELAENIYGVAAGYAAARKDLLEFLKVCGFCVGTGTMFPVGTTTMRVTCPKCKGSGMAKTIEEIIKADPVSNPYYSGPVKHPIFPLTH